MVLDERRECYIFLFAFQLSNIIIGKDKIVGLNNMCSDVNS